LNAFCLFFFFPPPQPPATSPAKSRTC
jgi:hypothetical protein